jgi:hypothetical protein
MPKTFLSAAAILLLAATFNRPANGGEPYIDPSALGQQAQAKAADGQIVISRVQTKMVYEIQTRTEKRTRVVEVDGEKREEEIAVEVPVTICKPVQTTMQRTIPIETAQAFDMQGQRVEANQLTDALAEGKTVLLATRKVPRYYLTIYRPDTLLLVMPAHEWQGAPLAGVPMLPALTPVEGVKPEAPRILPAPTAPTPSAPPEAPRTLPAPVVSAPPAEARALPAPAIEPQVSMARIVEDKIGLRRYVKDVSTQTAMRTIEQDGIKKLAPFSIEVESITDVERKYPQAVVKIQRADGKALDDGQQAKLLASDRCVLVSGDGQAIDDKYLKIVKPEALVVIVPPSAPPSPPVKVAPVPIPAPPPPAPIPASP